MTPLNINYPKSYPKLSERKKGIIFKHTEKCEIESNISAYYKNWDDFCLDWCGDVGYTIGEARRKLYENRGEFFIFRD